VISQEAKSFWNVGLRSCRRGGRRANRLLIPATHRTGKLRTFVQNTLIPQKYTSVLCVADHVAATGQTAQRKTHKQHSETHGQQRSTAASVLAK